MVGNESTNRLISDTNPDVPRVIKRGSVNYGAYSAFGSLYRAATSVTLTGILASTNPIIDCYHYTTGGGVYQLDKMNYSQSDATGSLQYVANYWLDTTTSGGQTVIRINFEHIRPDQLSRDAYYIVYSSKFTKDIVF